MNLNDIFIGFVQTSPMEPSEEINPIEDFSYSVGGTMEEDFSYAAKMTERDDNATLTWDYSAETDY